MIFFLSFQRIVGENNTTKDRRDSFSHHYIPNARIKDFNALIDGKNFFDLPIKNEEEAQEKITEISKNNDCTTGNLLDFVYFKKIYKLIAIYLIKQTKLKDPQQIIFIGRILAVRGVAMFFIIEKSEETTFKSLENSVNYKNGNTKDCKFVKQF